VTLLVRWFDFDVVISAYIIESNYFDIDPRH